MTPSDIFLQMLKFSVTLAQMRPEAPQACRCKMLWGVIKNILGNNEGRIEQPIYTQSNDFMKLEIFQGVNDQLK